MWLRKFLDANVVATCWYMISYAWMLKHEMEEIFNENLEIITIIFDMMNKFIERFEFMENQLWKRDKTMTGNKNIRLTHINTYWANMTLTMIIHIKTVFTFDTI